MSLSIPPSTTAEIVPASAAVLVRIAVAIAALVATGAVVSSGSQVRADRQLVAHRGASAYAPEHTRLAYNLAITQGADFIEPDLTATRDDELIVLHDETLERTTDVETKFPDRARMERVNDQVVRRWYPADFTLAELRQLDAGSWFDARTAGERLLTFDEVIEIARKGRVGLMPELKIADRYEDQRRDIVDLVAQALSRRQLDGDRSGIPVMLQTFDEATARALAVRLPRVKRLLLINQEGAAHLSDGGLDDVATYATGIGPDKSLLDAYPDAVGRAHVRGLSVFAWTFKAAQPGRFADVSAEMTYFLSSLGVDGVFTDNPDLFPSRRR